ncbi:hypothetical protein Q3G72_006962 [Acer saccharum]|nr:hypothetical protein Q3G72_006962 [Acer saccharum]
MKDKELDDIEKHVKAKQKIKSLTTEVIKLNVEVNLDKRQGESPRRLPTFQIIMMRLQVHSHNQEYGVTQGSLQPQECGPRCSTRCSKTQYKKPCLFFCNKCCAKCLCVPAGFYGNKESCPCYNNWKTKRGGPKCP